MESNDYIRLFTESSEDMGIMFESYKDILDIVKNFMGLVETKVEELIKNPKNSNININDQIAEFKNNVTREFQPSSIIIGEIPKTYKKIKNFRKELDYILDRLAKLKNRVSFGGNIIRSVILRPRVYSKNIDSEAYDSINSGIRNVDRSLDWIEKILIDLYNMVDQDLNILTIVYRIYAKKKIYENSEHTSDLTLNQQADLHETIQESLNWIEDFVHDEEFRENAYNMMINLENPNSLMMWMRNNIRYGWKSIEDNKVHGTGEEDDENYFFKYYRLQSPTDVAINKVGVCWDQCELQRRWFGKHGIEHGIFYIELQDDQCLPTHTFLAYKQNDVYWWFEHSWGDMRGIRRYDDLKSLILDVVLKHQAANNDRKSPVYVSWLMEPPTFGITCEQYMNYAHSQKQLDVNNLPTNFYESAYTEAEDSTKEEETESNEDDTKQDDVPPPEGPSEEPTEEPSVQEEDTSEEPPPPLEEPQEEENPSEEEPSETVTDEPIEEPKEDPKPESLPKQTDRAESDKNGVRRKKLYIAFIEWCKEYNPKNSFGSIFDKDAFKVSYPFIPDEMRYFYRLANPMLCVLAGDLTFFPVAELRKLNEKNTQMDKLLIFAATPNDLRVFNIEDKKVYRATEENGTLTTHEMLGDTFDLYIQKMVNKGDILNGPLEESVFVTPVWW